VTAIGLLAAPEGIAAIELRFGPDALVTVVGTGLDERIDERGCIGPRARRRRRPALRRRLTQVGD